MEFDMNTIQLCSPEDWSSFLLPSFGFRSYARGLAYHGSEAYQQRNFIWGDEYQPIDLPNGSSYIPRAGSSYDYSTSSLFPLARGRDTSRPCWVTLRAHATPRPDGAYNTALLVEGKRSYHRFDDSKRGRHPQWWRHVTDGRRDCFTVWARPNARGDQPEEEAVEPGPFTIVGEGLRFYTARSGCGVIYSREQFFDDNACPNRERTDVLLISFSIKDRDPGRDDMMKVQIHHAPGFSPESYPDLHSGWLNLIDIATRGFDRFCRPIPEQEDKRRLDFLEQNRKGEVEGPIFRAHIGTLNWQEALRLVKEPWQLEVVVWVHCNTRFDESTFRFDTTSTRVGRMLAQHECDSHRRQQLDDMTGYLAARNNLWCYSGD